MQSVAVLYASKYGSARRYAQWLGEALQADVYDVKGLSLDQVLPYQALVLCGGVFASGIKGMGFFSKNFERLKPRRLYALAVGASPADPENLQVLRQRYAKSPVAGLPMFYARGAWDVSAMTTPDRLMCTMLYNFIKKKPIGQVPVWARALVENWDQKADWTDREALAPLIDRLQQDLSDNAL